MDRNDILEWRKSRSIRDEICDEICEGARLNGEKVPTEERVKAVLDLLSEIDEETQVPADLVSSLEHALQRAPADVDGLAPDLVAERPVTAPAAHVAVLRVLWAELRFMPVSFVFVEMLILLAGLLINRYVTGFSGGSTHWSLSTDTWSLVAAASLDASTLLAPLLGFLAVIFSLAPSWDSSWADIEEISVWPRSTRLLARTLVTSSVPLAGAAVLSLVDSMPGPAHADRSLLLLVVVRTAPLFLTVSWALFWAVRYGWVGATTSTFLLWFAQFAAAHGRGIPGLLVVPETLADATFQYAAIAISVGLIALTARCRPYTSSTGPRLAKGTGGGP